MEPTVLLLQFWQKVVEAVVPQAFFLVIQVVMVVEVEV
jgi:hypothetical protein